VSLGCGPDMSFAEGAWLSSPQKSVDLLSSASWEILCLHGFRPLFGLGLCAALRCMLVNSSGGGRDRNALARIGGRSAAGVGR
jgi:hypothetical protein